jgi:hypothetical protein
MSGECSAFCRTSAPPKHSALSASARSANPSSCFSKRRCSSRDCGDRHIPAKRWCSAAIARYSIALTMVSSYARASVPACAGAKIWDAKKRAPSTQISKGKDRTPCVGVSMHLSLPLRRHGVERIPHRSSLPWPESAAQHSGHSTGTFQMSRAYSLMARSEENQAMLAVLRMLMRVQADAERHSSSIRRCVP